MIVRVSFGKYIASKQFNDSSDSVQKLLRDNVLPSLPLEAKQDPNLFRKERFYTPDVETVLQNDFELLLAVFKFYKAKDKTKYFSIEHWMTFLESMSLIGTASGTFLSPPFEKTSLVGVDRRDAKLIFGFSQMTVIDELKRRHRAISWVFFDFLEVRLRSKPKVPMCF